MPLSNPLFLPDPLCCAPPHSVLDVNKLEPIRPYLCPKCLLAFDRHYGLTRNSFQKEDAMSELVLNESTRSATGRPIGNRQGGSPLPEFTLNYRAGATPEIADKSDIAPTSLCGCRNQPLPTMSLGFSRRGDGATVSSLLANGHSFDDTLVGGKPTVTGRQHGSDAEYGNPPRLQQTPDDEFMGEESLRRIGLQSGQPLDTPKLVFRKDGNGKSVSEIV